MIRRALALTALLLVGAPALTLAHLMPEGHGSTRLVGNKAYTLISVPVGVLSGFDDDGNGLISTIEAQRHGASLHRQLEKKVRLSDGRVVGKTLYQDLQVPHFDSSSAVTSRSVILIRVTGWDSIPRQVRLEADVFTKELSELSFRAILGDSTEIATLTKRNSAHTFFGPQPGPEIATLVMPAVVTAGLLLMYGLIARRRRRQPQASAALTETVGPEIQSVASARRLMPSH
jgi:hypothetical protein